jgi:membrane-associated HD superfamily phosphohydrolase
LTASEGQLASAIATPMFVANSRFSDDADPAGAGTAVADTSRTVSDTVKAGQVIVDQGHLITESTMIQIRYFGLDKVGVDWGRVLAWMLLGTVVVALMLGWLWRADRNTGPAAARSS